MITQSNDPGNPAIALETGFAGPTATDNTTLRTDNQVNLGQNLNPDYTAGLPPMPEGPNIKPGADSLYPKDPLGVGLQLGALGLQGLMQLGGPEEEKMRQLSSPITRQQFDPRASLNASQTAFNSAANQARNTTSRASMMGNLQGLASNAGRQRAQITDRYNQMNAQAQTQYETRVAQREAQNMRTKYAVDQMNAQNRAAHRTGLRTLGQSVSNLGQARVAQTENRKSVDLILQTFPMIREHFLAQMDAQKTS